MADGLLDQLVSRIADGSPVDWEALEREAGSGDEREWLACLKVIGEIAHLHTTGAGDSQRDDPAPDDPTTGVLTAGDEGEKPHWGKYVLRERVGDGGFGSVYRAWDPDLELEVAIKILHKRVAAGPLREALLAEGRALARIRHDNVVRVLSVEADDDRMALRMEFVRGETLEALVRRHGTFNAREAAVIGEDVCRALAAVHLASFVHRDVKAQNVMREQAGRIVLMDFGAGRHEEDLKVAGRVAAVGTPLYMAPELLAGQPASVSSDVYAVGVLLYYLVTGEYPVDGKSVDELKLAHMQGRRRPLRERRIDLPDAFVAIVDQALAADPAKRYGSIALCLEDLVALLRRTPADGHTSVKERVWRGATIVLALVSGILGLGALNSAVFNLALGRASFVNESLQEWWVSGLQSIVGPGALTLMAMAIGGVSLGCYRVLRTLSSRLAGAEARVLDASRDLLRRVGADAPVCQAALALSAAALLLVGAWFRFSTLIGAFLSEIVNAPNETLSLLGPDNTPERLWFRQAFLGVSLIAAAVYWLVGRWVRRGEKARVFVRAGAAAIVVLSLCTLDLPYRLLFQNSFEIVSYAGKEWYVIGKNGDREMLFGPDNSPPRNRIVRSGDPDVRRLGTMGSIFERFRRPAVRGAKPG